MSNEQRGTHEDVPGGRLLEREDVLDAIAGRVVAATEGSGGLALVVGSAGLGKTAVLDQAAAIAAGRGLIVLSARASELERKMPFGVVRQLFTPSLRAMSGPDRDIILAGAAGRAQGVMGFAGEPAGADASAVIDGLYWLAANLSGRGPLLLVIDDLHWVDTQTARWLAYLGSRLRDLPMLVLAAARPDFETGLLSDLVGDPDVNAFSLGPLGVSAVSELVRTEFGCAGQPAFVDACLQASGGNPFYVCELLRAAAQDGMRPTDEQAAGVAHLGPREVRRSILVRLAKLGENPGRLATAVAILGAEAEIRHAAQLSNLQIDEALGAWDVLTRTEILRAQQPLEFFHPIVRAVVQDEIPAGERSQAHRQAAQILADDDAPSAQIALHALACEPLGDAQVVDWLRGAARDAIASGAPDAAAGYLKRALGEPPARARRSLLQFEVGQALLGTDTSAAATAFACAATDPAGLYALQAHRWRGYSLAYAGRMREAIASFDRAIALAGADAELDQHLSGTRDFYASWWSDDPDRSSRQHELQERARALAGDTPGERRILAVAALNLAQTGTGPATLALTHTKKASQASLTWLDVHDGSETSSAVGNTLTICDDPTAAELYTRWLAEVRGQGWTVNIGAGYFQRALVRLRRGELLEAEADARTSWNLVSQLGESAATIYWWSAATLTQVLIARGELTEAAELITQTGLGQDPLEVVIYPWPAVLRGELAVAEGRYAEGIDTLREAGAWLEERGFQNPAYIPWRAIIAPALTATGQTNQAREVIEPAVQRARSFGTPWALGMALRAAGTAEQGPTGIKLLREAAAVLHVAGCRSELAHALLELGATLRRSNQRKQAREQLREALDLAHRCGAQLLAERAERELFATGARPRGRMLSGIESLTASELRVAELAATGLNNPEIAQQLFITRKTVETHLGRAYLKLGINSRALLPDKLS
jgi:DNA-binding CsgD family transcriptional regulator